MEKPKETTEETQVKSRARVRDFGEVNTRQKEVRAMCDLAGDLVGNPEGGTVLEPACGDGNFLEEILRRKCGRLEKAGCRIGRRNFAWSRNFAERFAFRLSGVLSLLYGIDLLPDNAVKCRRRLVTVLLERFDAVVGGRDAKSRALLEEAAGVVAECNVVCGDALTMKRRDGAPIVFAKWRAESDGDRLRFGVTPYFFRTLVEGERTSFEPQSLFDAAPDLRRSAQIPFHEICRIRAFLEESRILAAKENDA